jgi:MtN3 and saliva related transmembrane protein
MTSSATVIGFVAGLFTTAANLPQVWKTYRVKSGEGLSFRMLSSLAIGLTLWITYGCFVLSWPIIVSNALGLLLIAALLIMKLKYDKAPTKD